ncbi:MAG: VanZ family protein, partial [Spirosomaceae bacterium]|nr:VanZ family protein [Spirosomataceae bacterium]
LCTLPSEQLPQGNDKTAHFAVFAIFSFLWLFISQNVWKVLLWGIVFGVFIEFWQAMLPVSFHRSGDIWDAVADAVGVVIGIGIQYIYKKIFGD